MTSKHADEIVLEEGDGVLVRTRFDGRWARGYEIARVRLRGAVPPVYRIQRRSDHAVLPGFFPGTELRPE
ncbi:MAG TPA: hypothetical protein VFB78_14105 [Acidimicrobiales bacterium]|nr:hypothetical protein [Acidimicrobiales bacterium]